MRTYIKFDYTLYDKKMFDINYGEDFNLNYLTINTIFNYFNDFNVNNYIFTYIYIDDDIDDSFNPTLYNKYYNIYKKYYNSDFKFVIITNNIKYCKDYIKFFNCFYIYIILEPKN